MAPVVLGLAPDPILDQGVMISTIQSDWDLTQFFTRPVSGLLGGLTVLTWCAPLLATLVARWLGTGAGSDSKG
jgi:putative tricarboxylic transport membrane protein